jgi:hypothetical protein
MVESPFGVTKFTESVNSIFSGRDVCKSINIETRTAVLYIDDILTEAKGKIDNVTIGRTDLSLSYFDPEVEPDSEFIFDLVDTISFKVCAIELALTIGGSITTNSIKRFKECRESWGGRVSNLETRKIILPTDKMLNDTSALREALGFEELCLRIKLATEKWLSRADEE